MDFVLFAFNKSKMEVPSNPVALVSHHIECLTFAIVLHFLRNTIEHGSREINFDILEIWRHLEINHNFAIILYL